ncbi:MAG: alpha-mannosidase, partial [Anaerolineae bacterium]|nr:alpha-mannosidase [Anaerolineae bacterium]
MLVRDAMTLTPEWLRRITNWHKVLSELFYRPLGVVSLQGFTTLEQLKAGEALAALFHPMPPGTPWGAKWEYGWFKGSLTLPAQAAGERVVLRLATGAESLVWIDGRASGARDTRHAELTLALEGVPGTRYTILAESYAGHGAITVGGDPAPHGVETVPEPGSTQRIVGETTFGIWDETLYQLWLDVTTLLELREHLDLQALRVAEIDRALQDVTLIVDLELPRDELLEVVRAGRGRLAPVLACINGSTAPVLTAFGHAHLDVAWLWPLQETERKMARTIANQLALLEAYPEYIFLQSQPHLYTMLEKQYPALYARFQEKVRTGQIVAEGATWVEPDTNITGGESLIRQFLHGKRFFRERFGIESVLLWLPDVFGYSGALPQIMRGCGVPYFATQKIMWAYGGGDRFPYNEFIWEGIDGSEVIAHICHGYGYPTSPAHLIRAWRERAQSMGPVGLMLPFGYGDGGGGPTRDHLEFARRARDLEGAPCVRMASPRAFFEDLEARGGPQARYVGELYFQAHRGTYTSQARTKLGNRRSEIALREAELWAVAARALSGYDLPRDRLEQAWVAVLLNQFHDILPGSSIARVYEEAERAYAEVIATATAIRSEAESALVTEDEALTIFNSLSWPRTVLAPLPAGYRGARNAAGEACLSQMCEGETWVETEAPPCGWTTLVLDAAPSQPCIGQNLLRVGPGYVENAYLRAEFNEAGELCSYIDKESGRELCAAPGNVFKLFKDVPGWFDAWDIDSMYRETPVPLDREAKVEVGLEGPLVVSLRVTRTLHDSPMTQEIRLRRGSRRLEFVTTIDWRERHKLLKVAFPVTVHANEAIHEIQYGHVRRPTHHSRRFDADRFEVCQHKWTALAEEGRGVAILNDSKYGISVLGHTLELTLLKSAMAPDMRADLGKQQFTYALVAWNGSFFESPVVAEGYDLNVPVAVALGAAGARSL